MTLSPNPHRAALAAEAAEILNRYQEFPSDYQVSFTAETDGPPRLVAHLNRRDGVPFAESQAPTDRKLAKLRDQQVVIRPFYLPMMARKWEESDANEFSNVDFDYAAILGYAQKEGEPPHIRELYFLPADTLLDGQRPGEDGVWRLRLATYHVSRMSLDPRKSFARFLYLAERIREGLEYQYDTYGFFYSAKEK